MARIYGIDLGTTYSCIAVVDDGRPTVLMNSDNEPTLPSVVYFESEQNVVVGQHAKDVAQVYPDKVISTIKRVMGKPDWKLDIDGRSYTPQEISAFILRKLVEDAEIMTGETIEDVVITVPAYFGNNERDATRQAGALAGLNVKKVVFEPTAAAVAYGMDKAEDQVVMVYDLGGGTFDVTMIQFQGDEINVLFAPDGDHELGGKNWDEAIALHFANYFSDQTGTPVDEILGDAEAYQELMAIAENSKEKLTTMTKVDQRIQFDTERVVCTFTREDFERITRPLLERTIALVDNQLKMAMEDDVVIDKILLVGGSTFMPQVIDRVRLWCAEAGLEAEIVRENPNQVVALGAALMGLKESVAANPDDLEGIGDIYKIPMPDLHEIERTEIHDVTSRSFGVVVLDHNEDSKLCNLITVGERYPTSERHRFHVAYDGATAADIRCMENREPTGSDELIDYEEEWEIGRTRLHFPTPRNRGDEIEIAFELGQDGRLNLTGRDITSGTEVEATFTAEGLLSDAEMGSAKDSLMKVKLNV